MRFALQASGASILILAWSITSTFAQENESVAERYGLGANGTIGRGTYVLPRGPSDTRAPSDGGGLESGSSSGRSARVSTGPGVTWYGNRYGLGANGTIGRGTYILPGGPAAAPNQGSVRTTETALSGSRNANYTAPAVPPSRPYPTDRYYVPGDGYRYQLYYNPSTRSYFYHPMRR